MVGYQDAYPYNGHINFSGIRYMIKWFKYIAVSTIMALSIFFGLLSKGEYNYMAFPMMFILNTHIFFWIKIKNPLKKGFCLVIS